jgi:uncharacterized protein
MKGTVAIVAVAAALAAACAGPSLRLKLAAGPQGGTWYPLAGALKNAIERQLPGAWVQVVPGGGVANVKSVEIGRADIAFANSVSTVDAMNGAPPFTARATRVCNLATLYPQYLQIITLKGAGIEEPADLRNRAVTTQPKGNTGEASTLHLLKAYGLTPADLAGLSYGSYTESVALMKDGNAEVFTLGTSVPASSVMDLASSRDITLMPLPDEALRRMQAINGGYQRVVIPAGTYPGQDREVQTIGYATHLIARCDLAADIVEGILDALHGNLATLAAASRDLRKATPATMSADIGVPLHRGAAQWYSRQGIAR